MQFDNHITFDMKVVSLIHTNTHTIIFNQDQTTGMIPKRYLNINSQKRERDKRQIDRVQRNRLIERQVFQNRAEKKEGKYKRY